MYSKKWLVQDDILFQLQSQLEKLEIKQKCIKIESKILVKWKLAKSIKKFRFPEFFL